jgi:endoglucanase
MHKALGNYCDILDEKGLFEDERLMDRFIAVWLMLEDEFHADEEVIFELLNEVVNATAEQWNALAKRTVTALREKNKTRRIILGCTEWNNPPGLPAMQVLEDENVFYTFHCYAPHEFTHQRGVLQAQQLFYNREMPYPTEDIERYRDYHRVVNGNEHAYLHLDRMDKAFLYEYLAPVKEWIEKHPDKILWCGEFGTIRHAKLAWRESWMRDMISILNEWDIPYCVWNYLSTPNDGNRFSLVDDDTRELLGEGFKSILLGNG